MFRRVLAWLFPWPFVSDDPAEMRAWCVRECERRG